MNDPADRDINERETVLLIVEGVGLNNVLRQLSRAPRGGNLRKRKTCPYCGHKGIREVLNYWIGERGDLPAPSDRVLKNREPVPSARNAPHVVWWTVIMSCARALSRGTRKRSGSNSSWKVWRTLVCGTATKTPGPSAPGYLLEVQEMPADLEPDPGTFSGPLLPQVRDEVRGGDSVWAPRNAIADGVREARGADGRLLHIPGTTRMELKGCGHSWSEAFERHEARKHPD